jgi:hypothetical protein
VSTDVLPTSVLLFRARRDLDNARIAQQQAEDAQHVAEEDKRVAEEQTRAERDRGDGLESHLRRVLIEHVVEPATEVLDDYSDKVDTADVPDAVLDNIAAGLIKDLEGGSTVDGLHEVARRRLSDWAEEQ